MNKKIIELYKKNESVRSISRILNKSTTYITKILKEEKVYKNIDNKTYFNKENRFPEINNYQWVAVCKKTGEEFGDFKNMSGTLSKYLIESEIETRIPSSYERREQFKISGEYWHEKYFNIKSVEIKHEKKKKCKFCDWNTVDLNNKSGAYTSHIREEHNLEIEEYLNKFPEEENLFSTFIKKKEDKNEMLSKKDNFINCVICNKRFKRITNTHLKDKHQITIGEYRKKFGETMSKTSSKKQALATVENNKKIIPNKKKTGIEVKFEECLKNLDINYSSQVVVDRYIFDFYLTDYNLYVEIDGEYWHGYDRDEKWSYDQICNIIKDYKKSSLVSNLVRLRGNFINNELDDEFNQEEFVEFIKENSINIKKHKLFNLKEYDVLLSKEYCKERTSFFKQKKFAALLKEFIEEFYPPNIYYTTIELDKRKQRSLYLKGIFAEAYYQAHKRGCENLEKTFKKKGILHKSIEYRLGINNYNEFFDISLKNIYKGIEVRTMFNVGVFPPTQAENIYNEFVSENSTVYDPFAGWGSRLLGMKSLIENKGCEYFGNDINKELKKGYNFLIKSKFKGKNVNISFLNSKKHISKLENEVDFIFTSPPFFNDENYSKNHKDYKKELEWTEDLILPVFKNCFSYLKKSSKIAIDMNSPYKDSICLAMKKIGFKIIEIREYNIKRSHYVKKNNSKTKKQILVIGEK